MNAIEKMEKEGALDRLIEDIMDTRACPSRYGLQNKKEGGDCVECFKIALTKEYDT